MPAKPPSAAKTSEGKPADSGGDASLASAKQRLGARLRGLRRDRGWTLDRTAAETGVSRASLSKIEKGQMSPTFDAMTKLARGFALDVTALIPNDAAPDRPASGPLGRRTVTRAGEGRPYPSPNYVNALLAADISQKAFLPFRTRVKARALADFTAWHRHDSEDFVFVLSGRMAFHCELYEPVVLGPGDSVYFDGRMGHAMVSLPAEGATEEAAEDAVVLWISSPAAGAAAAATAAP